MKLKLSAKEKRMLQKGLYYITVHSDVFDSIEKNFIFRMHRKTKFSKIERELLRIGLLDLAVNSVGFNKFEKLMFARLYRRVRYKMNNSYRYA